MKDSTYILYDADCGFCDWTQEIISKRDKTGRFTFVDIKSEQAQALAQQAGVVYSPQDPESFVVHQANTCVWLEKADAIRYITKYTSGWLIVIRVLVLITPRVFINWFYSLVSHNRARISKMMGHKVCKID